MQQSTFILLHEAITKSNGLWKFCGLSAKWTCIQITESHRIIHFMCEFTREKSWHFAVWFWHFLRLFSTAQYINSLHIISVGYIWYFNVTWKLLVIFLKIWIRYISICADLWLNHPHNCINMGKWNIMLMPGKAILKYHPIKKETCKNRSSEMHIIHKYNT